MKTSSLHYHAPEPQHGNAGRHLRGISHALYVFLILIAITSLPGCSSSVSPSQQEAVSASEAIENKGSDTLVNLALAWAEQYMQINPLVRISVTGGGSGTGIAALINGTVDIANASRDIKPEEREAARRNGIEPAEYTVALDAIAVIVNLDNPIDRLTLQQISDIYTGKITNWRELGGEDRPIVSLSRESNSGTYVYFLEHVIRMGGDNDLLFSPDTLLMPSSEGIIEELKQNPNAIGYDGLGYVTPDVKVVAVARDSSGPYVMPSIATVNDGSYPISRPLYVYTDENPSDQVLTYIRWILTDGQTAVKDLGFVPLGDDMASINAKD